MLTAIGIPLTMAEYRTARYLLDTSVYSQPLRRTPLTGPMRRWQAAGDERCVTSVVCVAEVLYGIRLKGSHQMLDLFEQVIRPRFPILPVDERVGETFAQLKTALRQQGQVVADLDLLIAATAKSYQLTVATLNAADFSRVPGIAVENWGE